MTGQLASSGGGVLRIAVGVALVLLLMKAQEAAHVVLSAMPCLMAALRIYGGFTNDLYNWPSEFWRWAGIAVKRLE
jgi:hypothetical protein